MPSNLRVADAENPAHQAESAIKRFFRRFFRILADCDLPVHHVRIVKPIAIPSFMFLKTDKPIQSILQSLPAKQRVYSIINISGLIQFFVLRIFGKPKPLISAAENLL